MHLCFRDTIWNLKCFFFLEVVFFAVASVLFFYPFLESGFVPRVDSFCFVNLLNSFTYDLATLYAVFFVFFFFLRSLEVFAAAASLFWSVLPFYSRILMQILVYVWQ